MYAIFLIWQSLDMQVIAIHAFHKIYLNIKMSDFEVKTKICWRDFFKVYTTDTCIYKLNNATLNLNQVE